MPETTSMPRRTKMFARIRAAATTASAICSFIAGRRAWMSV